MIYPSTTSYPSTTAYPIPSPFDILIFDRTQEDITHRNELHDKIANNLASATELAEWLNDNQRGSYNYTDLNRVGYLLNIVQQMSANIGIIYTYPHTVKTDYTRNDKLSSTNIAQLLANVAVVKNVYSAFIPTTLPTAIKTLDDANKIEYILYSTKSIFEGEESSRTYSGDRYSGGEY